VPAAAGSARAAARSNSSPSPRSPDARPTPERLARVVGPPQLLGDFLGRGGAFNLKKIAFIHGAYGQPSSSAA
jgi:hypothetical protein